MTYKIARPLLVCSALALAGCGGGLANSWVNPGNWFGQSQSQAITENTNVNPLIPKRRITQRKIIDYQGTPVDQIQSLRIERKPGGALINVVGLANVIGSFDVRLQSDTEDGAENGVLSYTLKAIRPNDGIRGGGTAARQIVAARFVSDQQLAGVRTIVVKGARNQRSTRRR